MEMQGGPELPLRKSTGLNDKLAKAQGGPEMSEVGGRSVREAQQTGGVGRRAAGLLQSWWWFALGEL